MSYIHHLTSVNHQLPERAPIYGVRLLQSSSLVDPYLLLQLNNDQNITSKQKNKVLLNQIKVYDINHLKLSSHVIIEKEVPIFQAIH